MKQTAPEYIKSQGLPSLVYVAKKVNKDPRTIYKWYHANFALFEAVVAGVWLTWADENKQPDPNITEEMRETDREYLKRARWNQ